MNMCTFRPRPPCFWFRRDLSAQNGRLSFYVKRTARRLRLLRACPFGVVQSTLHLTHHTLFTSTASRKSDAGRTLGSCSSLYMTAAGPFFVQF